ncbi:glycosyltransferase family 2 protein [Desulfoplanes sp. PS50]
MKTAIVILNYNDAVTTMSLVSSIKNYRSLNHIVIVDNCSTDQSYTQLIALKSEKIDVIKSDKNGGYSYGNNYGIKFIITNYEVDIFFIANPDVLFEEKIIFEIIEQFEKTSYAMLSGVMCYPNGNVVTYPIGVIHSYFDDIVSCFMAISSFRKRYKMPVVDYSKNIIDVDILLGSFFAIRASVIKTIGCFDEGTFLYCEERILGRRLQDNGYKIGLIPHVTYLHAHGSSTGNNCNALKTRKMLFDSRFYYQLKYNNINWFQKKMFKICTKFSLLEFRAYLMFKKIFTRLSR